MEKYCFNNNWEVQEIEGDVVLFCEESKKVVVMNSSGRELIDLLKEDEYSYEKLFEKFKKTFEPDSDLERDLQDAVDKLVEVGIIIKR